MLDVAQCYVMIEISIVVLANQTNYHISPFYYFFIFEIIKLYYFSLLSLNPNSPPCSLSNLRPLFSFIVAATYIFFPKCTRTICLISTMACVCVFRDDHWCWIMNWCALPWGRHSLLLSENPYPPSASLRHQFRCTT